MRLPNGRGLFVVTVIDYRTTDIGALRRVQHRAGLHAWAPSGAACSDSVVRMKHAGTGQYVWDLPVSSLVSVKGGKGIWGMPKHQANLDFRRRRPHDVQPVRPRRQAVHADHRRPAAGPEGAAAQRRRRQLVPVPGDADEVVDLLLRPRRGGGRAVGQRPAAHRRPPPDGSRCARSTCRASRCSRRACRTRTACSTTTSSRGSSRRRTRSRTATDYGGDPWTPCTACPDSTDWLDPPSRRRSPRAGVVVKSVVETTPTGRPWTGPAADGGDGDRRADRGIGAGADRRAPLRAVGARRRTGRAVAVPVPDHRHVHDGVRWAARRWRPVAGAGPESRCAGRWRPRSGRRPPSVWACGRSGSASRPSRSPRSTPPRPGSSPR